MADSFKATVTVPVGYQRMFFDKNLYFMREDGMYCLPPGEYNMPFPMWGKMAVEQQPNNLEDKKWTTK